MDELYFQSAARLAERIASRELSARDLVECHLARIEQVNPGLNAIVTLTPERALEQAARADELQALGRDLGPLHGLPIAHKDLVATAGIRTTYGSPLYADHVPVNDELIIERLRRAGAVTVGKTNTPEFGAGSQTFNEVFGATCNPYDVTKTCGGSSGGAAVALAAGMIPIADGSDTGGSLRNPANFCNIVGFRPSPGRVPQWPAELGWFPISVQGPMARWVEDVALMMTAIAGPDSRSPIAIAESSEIFARPLDRGFAGTRIAWSRHLNDLPVDRRVTETIDAQRATFADLGCEVEDADPDFRDADEIFKAWRAWKFELRFARLLESDRDRLKETIIWNAEEGKKLTGPQLSRLEARRTQLFHRMRTFMDKYEFLIAPVSQVPPFDINTPYIKEIEGIEMETYIDWMKSCYYITVTGHPAISVPCGFTADGLPVGVQIVGRHQDDFGVLQLAYAFQQATRFAARQPRLAKAE